MTHKDWFVGDHLNPPLNKVYVVLSNGCDYGVKSFISDNTGKKLNTSSVQLGEIFIELCGSNDTNHQ